MASPAVVVAQVAPIDCDEPKACSELALEARARGAYETFHDLAWRAVQTGTPNDPDLMYLLARAQALSGRRRDAIVVLRRLAESGVVTDAATHEDLRRVRELPEWAYIAGLSARARPTAAATASAADIAKPVSAVAPAAAPPPVVEKPAALAAKPSPPVVEKPAAAAAKPPPPAVEKPAASAAKPAPAIVETPAPAAAKPPPAVVVTPSKTASVPPAPPAVRSALRIERATVEEAARFSTQPFVPGGVAYDAVSRRLLFGDVTGRRLFVVGDGSDRTVDLVRADSAGFDDVTAIAVDAARGDLWVASSGTSGGGALHRLQLISGRALTRTTLPGEGLMRLTDLAVTGDGTVVILDGATPRVFVRRPAATSVTLLMALTAPDPVGITVDDEGRFAYVAHSEGITRIDVSSRRATPLATAKDVTLAGFEFIRWHRDGLVGSQLQPDGSRGLVRLRLNRAGSAVSQATLIGEPPRAEGISGSATISGDDLYYLVADGSGTKTAGSPLTDVRVKRVTLR